jgi:hypothetical protein
LIDMGKLHPLLASRYGPFAQLDGASANPVRSRPGDFRSAKISRHRTR